ncbi:MAG: PQQ-binding-like beta-propeller repeat protein [Verrucomicrobia bacterium]|nr:PQQ-binding-like beta-propeller repeat protein [Verrucomicrobiota bacterium]
MHPESQRTIRRRALSTRLARANLFALAAVGFWLGLAVPPAPAAPVRGWLNWRGPEQVGVSRETGLPASVSTSNVLWTASYPGQSTPVLANGRLYIMGYQGEGADLQEGIGCFDAETGKLIWNRRYNDFISDTIYLRYATASPAIDPETGNIYMQGTQGILAAFDPDGQLLWRHSLMEEFGRLTFPNSRTASPLIDGDLVITRGITANWGAQGPASDRLYAFDKKTGELVWSATPGDRPKDNSYSHPYLGWFKGRRALFTALGDGSVACVNARTGEPLWRVPLFRAGINATVVVHNDDKVIALFGTPYELGHMVALKFPDVLPTNAASAPVVVDAKDVQLWTADISTSASHPILVGDTVYVVAEKGDLCAVDANSGKIHWKLKLGIEQRNASLLYADGRLFVPILDDPAGKAQGESEAGTKGAFYIIKPGAQPEILTHIELDGRCFGTPVAYNGKVYVQTTQKLYCFGKAGNNPGLPAPVEEKPWPAPGAATQLQIIPSEVLLHPAEKASFRVRTLDANGFAVGELKDVKQVKWASYVPPTARVKSTMKSAFNENGELVAAPDAVLSAGAFEASFNGLKGYIRGRVLPNAPIQQDFDSFTLSETNAIENAAFAYPPLPWIGARFKFEVRERDGNKCLVKTIDNKFFQRATVFIGTPDMKNYTVEADVMSDGNRRKMSEVGLINQRYAIVLKGNDQKIEVNSNLERLRQSVDLKWQPNVWYRLKSRVDIAADGAGVVRAKAWKKGEPEPEAWTIEVPHKTAHQQGSPGLFGFSPQDMRVCIDNVSVSTN